MCLWVSGTALCPNATINSYRFLLQKALFWESAISFFVTQMSSSCREIRFFIFPVDSAVLIIDSINQKTLKRMSEKDPFLNIEPS